MGKRRKTRKVGGSRAKRRNIKTIPSEENDVLPRTESNGSRRTAQAKVQPDVFPRNTNIHPLLIDHVLEKAFQYVLQWDTHRKYWGNEHTLTEDSVKNLQNIRLVCKKWNETATKLCRGEPLMWFGESHAKRGNIKCCDSKMAGFLTTMRNSHLLPVQRFSLNSSLLTKENERLMNDFLRICGPTLTELRLHLKNSDFSRMTTMSFTRRSFPTLEVGKLKKLVFVLKYFNNKAILRYSNGVPWLVGRILGAAVTLQEFWLETPLQYWQERNEVEVLHVLNQIILAQIPNSVKKLRLNLPMYEESLNTLMERNINLEELQLRVHFFAGMAVFRDFLTQQTSSLRVLKFLDSPRTGTTPMNFPLMQRLSNLEMQGFSVQPFFYQDIFPKLEILNFSYWKVEYPFLELLPSGTGSISLSMKEIYLPDRFPLTPIVKNVSRCFPNLKIVHLSHFPNAPADLVEIFIYLPHLEELCITIVYLWDVGEMAVESLFSGISEEDCIRIREDHNFDAVILKDVQTQPSITNLTKLRKLVVKDLAGQIILSDFAAHFIFLKMDSLTELHTTNVRFRMSARYLNLIEDKITSWLALSDNGVNVLEINGRMYPSSSSSDVSNDSDSS